MTKHEIENTQNEPDLEKVSETDEPEGLDDHHESWGEYPIDDLLIRNENRTIHDVLRRISKGSYVLDPEFQRDFIWPVDKQSKLIESVMMRIPLPVFYMAEDYNGRMVVVDGLQRLSTFKSFLENKLTLDLPGRPALDGRKFKDLVSKLQNRVEDCNLIFYIIDSRVPDRARLDIFERVNLGVPLTRQQMRNCLFMGPATRFLRSEASTNIFSRATGKSLDVKKMRDREFVNRFCAFQLLNLDDYRGDMDEFLADALRLMNDLEPKDLQNLSDQFRCGLRNNYSLFKRHAFRKHKPRQRKRSVLNASFWDVMSTGLSQYQPSVVRANAASLKGVVQELLSDENFIHSITFSTNDMRQVKTRFRMCHTAIARVLGKVDKSP